MHLIYSLTQQSTKSDSVIGHFTTGEPDREAVPPAVENVCYTYDVPGTKAPVAGKERSGMMTFCLAGRDSERFPPSCDTTCTGAIPCGLPDQALKVQAVKLLARWRKEYGNAVMKIWLSIRLSALDDQVLGRNVPLTLRSRRPDNRRIRQRRGDRIEFEVS